MTTEPPVSANAPSQRGSGAGADLSEQRWRSLRLLFLYRLTLATLFVTLFFGELGPSLFGRDAPQLFAWVSIAYAGAVLLSGLGLYWRAPSVKSHAALMLYIDVFAITLLMHASGGVEGGLGTLLLVSIAGSSLILEGITALVFAAIAALAVLGEQVYAQINHSFATTAYTHAGLLGAAYFAMAIVAHVLSLRVHKSEALATQRQLDLANLEELNAYIIQRMRTGVMVIDDGCDIRLMNGAARELLGIRPDSPGQPLDATSTDLRKSLRHWTEHEDIRPQPFRPNAGEKEIQPHFIRLGADSEAGMLIFLEDHSLVTRQAQHMKLAALGRLTASIAHEIRNPLSAISHAGQLLSESPSIMDGDRRLTEIIDTNSGRINRTIENVLQLSRRRGAQRKRIALGEWLEQFAAEFRHTHGLDCSTLEARPCPANIQVTFDPSHLNQVVTNLCQNALQHGGHDNVPAKVRLRARSDPERGEAYLEVQDNGPGIDPASTEKLFEPFFTTREDGTGLGLYVARELAENNKARIEYEPASEGGSCFRIHFSHPDGGDRPS